MHENSNAPVRAVGIPRGLLPDGGVRAPSLHIHLREKASWYHVDERDGLQQFSGWPPTSSAHAKADDARAP